MTVRQKIKLNPFYYFFFFFPLGKKALFGGKREEISPSLCFGVLLCKGLAVKDLQAHLQCERKIQ